MRLLAVDIRNMEITISSQTCLNSVILCQLFTAALTSPGANPSAQWEKDTSSCVCLMQKEVCETRGLSTPLSLGSSHVHGSIFSPLSRTLFIFLSVLASTAHSLWHHGLWRVSVFPHSLGFRVPEFSVHLFILLQLLATDSALVNGRLPRKGAVQCGGFMGCTYNRSVAVYCPWSKPPPGVT